MVTIGQMNHLRLARFAVDGPRLDGGALGEIPLPVAELPSEAQVGDTLEVFVYPGADGQPVATTTRPLACANEFACLRVAAVNARLGAFLDWGLPKDLLLPFREQPRPVRPGERVPVFVRMDERTGRLVASARIEQFLSRDEPCYRPNQRVNALVIARTPLGFKAIVNHAHLGLFFRDALPGPLEIGENVVAFVKTVRPDGKIDLSLDAAGYQRVPAIAERIVRALEQNGGALEFDDDSDPADIRAAFGVSKKAFKQALGQLYRRRRIRFCSPGIQLLDATTWSPGESAPPVRPQRRTR